MVQIHGVCHTAAVVLDTDIKGMMVALHSVHGMQLQVTRAVSPLTHELHDNTVDGYLHLVICTVGNQSAECGTRLLLSIMKSLPKMHCLTMVANC